MKQNDQKNDLKSYTFNSKRRRCSTVTSCVPDIILQTENEHKKSKENNARIQANTKWFLCNGV